MGRDGGKGGEGILRFEYTKHQVARGARPDTEVGDRLYLLKKVPLLRATYQIRLLAYRASQEAKKLVIRGPRNLRADKSLRELMANLPGVIRIERVD